MTTTYTPGSYDLVIAPHAGMPLITVISARLALTGTLRVLDCGNRYNVYPIAREIRRRSIAVDASMDNILITRAFTSYQVLAMLKRERAQAPVLVIDLLATYLDEDIDLVESRRLLRYSIAELARLSQSAPLLVTVKPLLPISAEREPLLQALARSAKIVYPLGTPGSEDSAEMLAENWPATTQNRRLNGPHAAIHNHTDRYRAPGPGAVPPRPAGR